MSSVGCTFHSKMAEGANVSCEKVQIKDFKYVLQPEKTHVDDGVLFGDCKDVRISNATKKPIESEGGTIKFTLRSVTSAVPGEYVHAKCYKGKEWFHLVHHESLDGEAIARFLYRSCGAFDFRLENVWNRYDWCHYRNWGSYEKDDEDKNKGHNNDDDYYDDEEEKDDDDGDYSKRDTNIYFVPVMKDAETGCPKTGKSIQLDDDCIEGDWFYGLRLVDPDSGLAYAYEFGDILIFIEDDMYRTKEKLERTDFNVKMDRFMPRPQA